MNPLKHNDIFNFEDGPMRGFRQAPTVLFLSGILLATCWFGPARADEERTSNPDTDVTGLVEDVLRKADSDDLGEWSRSILDRALKRAGDAARQTVPGSGGAGPGLRAGRTGPGTPGRSVDPLSAERHAGELSGPRAGTAEILVFTSLSVPAASWRQWAREAASTGAPLVLRGVSEDGLPATAREIGKRLDGAEAGVAIDPRLFRLFGVTRVPTVVVVPGGVPPCRSRGCAEDPAPAHDRVTGNIGLAAALQAVADEGAVGRDVAESHLERLREGVRP